MLRDEGEYDTVDEAKEKGLESARYVWKERREKRLAAEQGREQAE